jgi:hypothetical protein
MHVVGQAFSALQIPLCQVQQLSHPVAGTPSLQVSDVLNFAQSPSSMFFVVASFVGLLAPIMSAITIAATMIAPPIMSRYSRAPCPLKSIFVPSV